MLKVVYILENFKKNSVGVCLQQDNEDFTLFTVCFRSINRGNLEARLRDSGGILNLLLPQRESGHPAKKGMGEKLTLLVKFGWMPLSSCRRSALGDQIS